jgi:hypothetical protein
MTFVYIAEDYDGLAISPALAGIQPASQQFKVLVLNSSVHYRDFGNHISHINEPSYQVFDKKLGKTITKCHLQLWNVE